MDDVKNIENDLVNCHIESGVDAREEPDDVRYRVEDMNNLADQMDKKNNILEPFELSITDGTILTDKEVHIINANTNNNSVTSDSIYDANISDSTLDYSNISDASQINNSDIVTNDGFTNNDLDTKHDFTKLNENIQDLVESNLTDAKNVINDTDTVLFIANTIDTTIINIQNSKYNTKTQILENMSSENVQNESISSKNQNNNLIIAKNIEEAACCNKIEGKISDKYKRIKRRQNNEDDDKEDNEDEDENDENDEDYEDATDNSNSYEDYSGNSEYTDDEDDYTEEEKTSNSQKVNAADNEVALPLSAAVTCEADSVDGVLSEKEEDLVTKKQDVGNEEEELNKKVDDDEDKQNPAYIPRKGNFYQHDMRIWDEEGEAKVEETSDQQKKLWRGDSEKWKHDLYREDMPKTKSRSEIIAKYGFDIRTLDHCPTADELKSLNNEKRDRDNKPSIRTMGDFIQSKTKSKGRGRARPRDPENDRPAQPNSNIEKSEKNTSANNSNKYSEPVEKINDIEYRTSKKNDGRANRKYRNNEKNYTRTGRPELDQAQIFGGRDRSSNFSDDYNKRNQPYREKVKDNESNTNTLRAERSEVKKLNNPSSDVQENRGFRDQRRQRDEDKTYDRDAENREFNERPENRSYNKNISESRGDRRDDVKRGDRKEYKRGSRTYREEGDRYEGPQRSDERGIGEHHRFQQNSDRQKFQNEKWTTNERENYKEQRSTKEGEEKRWPKNDQDGDNRFGYRNPSDNRYQGNSYYQGNQSQDVRENYQRNRYISSQDENNFSRQFTNSKSDDKNVDTNRYNRNKAKDVREVESNERVGADITTNYRANKDYYRDEKTKKKKVPTATLR